MLHDPAALWEYMKTDRTKQPGIIKIWYLNLRSFLQGDPHPGHQENVLCQGRDTPHGFPTKGKSQVQTPILGKPCKGWKTLSPAKLPYSTGKSEPYVMLPTSFGWQWSARGVRGARQVSSSCKTRGLIDGLVRKLQRMTVITRAPAILVTHHATSISRDKKLPSAPRTHSLPLNFLGTCISVNYIGRTWPGSVNGVWKVPVRSSVKHTHGAGDGRTRQTW